jgi:hypothetical protein
MSIVSSGAVSTPAGAAPSFSKRHITLTFTLGLGDQGEQQTFSASSPNNVVTVAGLRVHCMIKLAGGLAAAMMEMDVYGLPQAVASKLSTLLKPLPGIRNNTVTVQAGSDATGLSQVYTGTITQAWNDPNQAPQTVFHVSANSGIISQTKSVPAVSFSGSVDVATVMAQIAQSMGLTLQNNGVSVQLSDPHYEGSAYAQMQSAAQAANITAFVDLASGQLAIWPKTGSRTTTNIVLSPSTGLIGYPSYSGGAAVIFRSIFNPALQFGTPVEIQGSIVTECNGVWPLMASIEHDIESEMPGGPWFSTIQALTLNFAPISPP